MFLSSATSRKCSSVNPPYNFTAGPCFPADYMPTLFIYTFMVVRAKLGRGGAYANMYNSRGCLSLQVGGSMWQELFLRAVFMASWILEFVIDHKTRFHVYTINTIKFKEFIWNTRVAGTIIIIIHLYRNFHKHQLQQLLYCDKYTCKDRAYKRRKTFYHLNVCQLCSVTISK